MNKRVFVVLGLLLIGGIYFSFSKEKKLIDTKMDSNKIDKIQVIHFWGDPGVGSKSKIITDEDEVKMFVDTFNSARVGKQVKPDLVEVPTKSRFSFYEGDNQVYSFDFDSKKTDKIWLDNNLYYIIYSKTKKTPYELYYESKANTVLVDEDGNYLSSGHKVKVKDIDKAVEFAELSDDNADKAAGIILDNFDEASELNVFDCGYNYEISIDSRKYYFCLSCKSVVSEGKGIILNEEDYDTLKEICDK